MSDQQQLAEDIILSEILNPQKAILLFNDDVNTFDHVIDSLIDICEHTLEQAEQCAILVHYKGKCTVKTGEYNDLKPRCTMLLSKGLSAEIL